MTTRYVHDFFTRMLTLCAKARRLYTNKTFRNMYCCLASAYTVVISPEMKLCHTVPLPGGVRADRVPFGLLATLDSEFSLLSGAEATPLLIAYRRTQNISLFRGRPVCLGRQASKSRARDVGGGGGACSHLPERRLSHPC